MAGITLRWLQLEIKYIWVGGSNTSNLSDWWEYDITQDSWSQKTSLPQMIDTILFILELVITRMLDLVMVQLRDLALILLLESVYTMIFIDMIHLMTHG